MHSNPPCHGDWIAQKMLKNPKYRVQFEESLKQVAQQFRNLRKALFEELQNFGDQSKWRYIVQQEGPFVYLELLSILL